MDTDIKLQLLTLLSSKFNLINDVNKTNNIRMSFIDIAKMYTCVYTITRNDENMRWLSNTYNDMISRMYLLSKGAINDIETLDHIFSYSFKYGKVLKVSSHRLNKIIANRRYLYRRFIVFLGYDILTDINMLIVKKMIQSCDNDLIVS